MFGTYKPQDVTLLLKDITGLVEPLDTRERERRIQRGEHYSRMLPIEYEPTPAYFAAYEDALARYAPMTARAGTPIGILIQHEIARRHGVRVAHYALSIIRGLGIDRNAMDYILSRHRPQDIQFVDGWTGKGAIRDQLVLAMEDYPGVSAGLAVLSDPARIAEKCGTHDDFLIASSCLNATVSGLLSRTFYREDIIGPHDFHGAAFYENLLGRDVTYQFIGAVEQFLDGAEPLTERPAPDKTAAQEVAEICRTFAIADRNLVKPGIGEATRVLLRRVPWKVLVHSLDDEAHLGHLYQLASEKGVELVEYPLVNYRACGLIRSMADN